MKYLLLISMFVYGLFVIPSSHASDEYEKYLKVINEFYLDPLGHKGTIYRIVNKESDKLMGIENCSLKNGANVRQWGLTGELCQKWLLFPISKKDYVIVNMESGKLVGIEGCSSGNGANIRQWEYTGETCQEWQFKPVEQDYFNLVVRHSNKMAGVKNCSKSNGANVRQWGYTGEECQKWKLQSIGQIDFPKIEVGQQKKGNRHFPTI